MPPCRTTPEIRDASMPDSRATIESASSEVWRCLAVEIGRHVFRQHEQASSATH